MVVAVIGPHFAGALVGRLLGEGQRGPRRRFEFALTHDRELVIRAAGTMMARILEPAAGSLRC